MCIYKSDKQVYEADCIDAQGDVRVMEVLECDSDEEAMHLAARYGRRYHTAVVKLQRVPYVNMSGAPSLELWPDQVKFIGEIPIDAD